MTKCPGCGKESPSTFRFCGHCGNPMAAASAALPMHEVRKTVTIVFTDLKGSTALGETLDNEAMHEVRERYFNAMGAEIARHGGKIEKYIGDAIMAVFGLPRAHEDDALRAVRAAVGMQGALAGVNEDLRARYGVALANRTGVNTGEVVANEDPDADQKLATGDAVNVAARLEQAAPENQIYLGEVTYRLVRDAVEVDSVEPLEMKGKAQRVLAYRLVSAHGLDGNLRRSDTTIVGRNAELAELTRLYREVVDGPAVRMATVIGDAGVGKSRLVHELATRITGATVLRGRCLPYGDGITFWPLRAMLSAADVRDGDKPEQARTKLMACLGDHDVVDRMAAATGLSAANYPLHEVDWAARKALEILAARAPVVLLVDDVHWAETAFLDLLEHVLSTSSSAPILLLVTARHELLEKRARWGEQIGASRIVLPPLSDAAAAQVVANLLGTTGLPQDVLNRIVDIAEGNPLYVEQLLSMLIDRGALLEVDGRWERGPAAADIDVPPTIHALLEARLDQLGRTERATVEPASVIGLEFEQRAVTALAPEPLQGAVAGHLGTLASKQFIHLASSLEDTPRYRFNHHLVRDTVYNCLLKRERARLHVEFVRWADRVNADRDRALEFEEILGYHLEQSHHYLRELGPLDENGREIGRDAARRLSSSGRRAFARGDMHAADSLLRRSIALLAEPDAQRLPLLPELAEVQLELGKLAEARALVDEASTIAHTRGNDLAKAAAELVRLMLGLHGGELSNFSDAASQLISETIPVLEREAAHSEIAKAWRLVAMLQQNSGRLGEAAASIAKVVKHARLSGDQRLAARSALGLAMSAVYGPTPVPQAIQQCEELVATEMQDRQVQNLIVCKVAMLHAMNGNCEAARDMARRARSVLRDLGQGVRTASASGDLAEVELLARDPAAAERELRPACEMLERMGETFFRSTMTALLARAVREQGRDDEALELTRAAEAITADADIDAKVLWRCVRAPILARSGAIDEAEFMIREALELALHTESPGLQASSYYELGAVTQFAGRADEARQALHAAIEIYARKGDVTSAARGRAFLAAL